MAQIRSDMWLDLYNRERNILALEQHMAEPVGIEIFARDPLHDRGFEVLPDLEKWRGWLPDLLLNSLTVWTVCWALLIPSQRRIKWQGIVTLRRFLWCLSVLYIFRMCSFMVTTLPSPAKNCMPKYVPVNEVEDVQEYLVFDGQNGIRDCDCMHGQYLFWAHQSNCIVTHDMFSVLWKMVGQSNCFC